MKSKRILFIVTTLLIGLISFSPDMDARKKNDTAKYIFLFIGDGMGFSQVAGAESYLSYKAGTLGGEQVTFTKFPVHGSASTHSANRRVTDSSAAGTAIATGVKTNNSMLGMDPEGNKLISMSYDLQDMGYNIGVFSSVPVNHATPASFYARNASRYTYYDIAAEIPSSGFQFLGGSGVIEYFGKKKDKVSIAEVLEKEGVNVCFSKEEADEAINNGDRMLVCQPYNKETEPSNYDAGGKVPEGHITLSEMMEMCLKRLGDKKPFFVMCEGGEIDWAGHANKTMPMILATLEFDKAIAEAYEFYLQHPDETLIVVTADHATGGFAINSKYDWEEIEEAWNAAGKTNNLDKDENSKLNKKAKFGWTTTSHTGEPVPVYAIGKGAERFGGRMDNTEFKVKILGK